MVEILSTCPIGWGKKPVDAMGYIESDMVPYYPLGVYKSEEAINQ